MKLTTKKSKTNTITSREWFVGNMVVVVLAIFVMTCVYINKVEYDDSVDAGQVAEFKVQVYLDVIANVSDARLVIGFLAPRSWSAAQNTTVTFTTEDDPGTQTMSLIPNTSSPKNYTGLTWSTAVKNRFGFGENVLDDMEWVMYWTDKTYTVNNGQKITIDVLVQAKAGAENLRFKPTFFVNETDDGLGTDDRYYKIYKGDCFTVNNGTGDLTDFCEIHFNSAQPFNATKDDFVTFGFQGDVEENDLIEEDKIFVCATAYTSGGQQIDVCASEAKSQMTKQFQYGNSYTLTIWPADYFSIPEGEEIVRIEYHFTNEDGSVEVLDNGDVPFIYTFKCQ